jgi:hypothetical protein
MIALRSENQILKKYIKDIKLQKLNINYDDSSKEMSTNQIDQLFESFNNNLNNYYYSYSKLNSFFRIFFLKSYVIYY